MNEYTRLSALLVENSPMMRSIISEMLRQFGVRSVVKVVNAEEAIKVTANQRFDFIILDFFLGSMDGGDFTRQLRMDESNRNRRIPILLVTAQPDHEKVLKSRDCGINEILAKPLSAKGLFTRLNAMLAQARPFIVSRDYTGPCRRRRTLPPPHGKDRRRGTLVLKQTSPAKPAEPQISREVVKI